MHTLSAEASSRYEMVAFMTSNPRIRAKSGKSSKMMAKIAATSIAHDSGFHMYLRKRSPLSEFNLLNPHSCYFDALAINTSRPLGNAPEVHKDGIASPLWKLVGAILL